MEQKNYAYLKDSVLPQLGFNQIFDETLQKRMELGINSFELKAVSKADQTEMHYALKFDKREGEFYFLNSIKATLKEKDKTPVEQTFALFKQRGFDIQEMKNLMQGRAVFKSFRKEGETVTRWVTIDLTRTNSEGNHPIRSYYESTTNFNLAREMSRSPIIHANQDDKEMLLQNLQKGELATVSIKENGVREKVFVTVDPNLGALQFYNSKMEKMLITNKNSLYAVNDEIIHSNITKETTKDNGVVNESKEKLPDATQKIMDSIKDKKEGQEQQQQHKKKVV